MTQTSLKQISKIAIACIALLAALAVALTCAQTAQAAPSVTVQVKQVGAKKFVKASKGKNLKKGFTAIKASGGAKVSISAKGAKKVKKAATAVKATSALSGYNAWCRVFVKGYGWTGWAKNGAAGSKGLNMIITKVEVKLLAASASENTDRTAYSAKSGFMGKITGNKACDKKIKGMVKKNGTDLLKNLKAINKFSYRGTGRADIGNGVFSSSRLLQEATYAFSKKAGNCYSYTAAAYYLAKYLGYDVQAIAGWYETDKGDVGLFSWDKIKIGGVWHVYDVTRAQYDLAPTAPRYNQYHETKPSAAQTQA